MIELEKLEEIVKSIENLPIEEKEKEENINNVNEFKVLIDKLKIKISESLKKEENIDKKIGSIFQKSFEKKMKKDFMKIMKDKNAILDIMSESYGDVYNNYDMKEEGEKATKKINKILKLILKYKENFNID